MKVLVFGYSDSPSRYSHLAANMLHDFQHETIKFNPRTDDPQSLDLNFDTLTLYVSKPVSEKFQELLLSLVFKRIIFNPGSENEQLEAKLQAKYVEVVHGCTLVMLKTRQF